MKEEMEKISLTTTNRRKASIDKNSVKKKEKKMFNINLSMSRSLKMMQKIRYTIKTKENIQLRWLNNSQRRYIDRSLKTEIKTLI